MNKRQQKKAQKRSTPPAPPAPAAPSSSSAHNAPPTTTKGPELVYVAPPPRQCDDELTVLATQLRPAHRRFADLILQGYKGCKAAEEAGFRATDSKSAATRLLRREDIRRYIRLAQREVAISTRVTLDAIVSRLWAAATDPQGSVKGKAAAMNHLVRIYTATGYQVVEKPAAAASAPGLTNDLVTSIEAQLLGIRQPGPEA